MLTQRHHQAVAERPAAAPQLHCVLTPARARMVLTLIPFGGACENYMTMAEVQAVRELFEADHSGSITFGAIVRRIAACEAEHFPLPTELVIWKALPRERRIEVIAESRTHHLNERLAYIGDNLRAYAALAGIELPEPDPAPADDDEGQPDEIQEWADFDPDC